jgi:two-component system chemotaxis response regulator CheB
MSQHKVRTLVVDDSALMRAVIQDLLGRSPEIEVVGTAADAAEARQMIRALDPDVVTLDVAMPGMDGVTFLQKIMTLRPMPVVMVSALTQAGADITLRALELGAFDFVAKPDMEASHGLAGFSGSLVSKVVAASKAKTRRTTGQGGTSEVAELGCDVGSTIIGIGASTGGVETLGRLLADFPLDAPGTVIAQHMPEHFTRHFAARLNKSTRVRVCEAEDGQPIRSGEVLIAPGGFHLSVSRAGTGYACRVQKSELVSGHRPSVDVLFGSLAETAGGNGVGLILTGMGRDGADGLLAMREAGAITIGQDEGSSLVYGMPKAAHDNGAVMYQVAENQIVETMMQLIAKRVRG